LDTTPSWPVAVSRLLFADSRPVSQSRILDQPAAAKVAIGCSGA
jgi:hypothetical protein